MLFRRGRPGFRLRNGLATDRRRSLATKSIALVLAGVVLAVTLTGWLGVRSARDALVETQNAVL